ncbi:hypothetical protein [Arabiibacter massiliensis]|uniref:hypothetical protein n=1 Tax=Arabiibacter massiliensis TaxID=1870985 RepID=UPI0009BC586D|nr:hypothetical protein [Arabiibacter massiliensis]
MATSSSTFIRAEKHDGGGASLSAFAATLVVLAAAFLLALCAAQPAHALDAKGKWDACDWEIKGDTFTVTAASGGNAIRNSPESIPWKRSADKADMTDVKRIVIGTKENPVKLEGNSANVYSTASPK